MICPLQILNVSLNFQFTTWQNQMITWTRHLSSSHFFKLYTWYRFMWWVWTPQHILTQAKCFGYIVAKFQLNSYTINFDTWSCTSKWSAIGEQLYHKTKSKTCYIHKYLLQLHQTILQTDQHYDNKLRFFLGFSPCCLCHKHILRENT